MVTDHQWHSWGVDPNWTPPDVEIPPAPVGPWVSLAPLAAAHQRNYAAAGVIGDALYVAGGFSGTGTTSTASASKYDFLTATWSAVAPMPGPLGFTSGAVIAGKLYVVTGDDTNSTGTRRNFLYVYDSATNTWATKAPMPAPLAVDRAAVAAVDGKLYVAGGAVGNIPSGPLTSALYAYDPATNTWATKAAMPAATARGYGAELLGKLYVVGAYTGDGTVVAPATYVYDPATDTWATRAPATTGEVAASWGGRLYTSGIYDTGRHLEQYDPWGDTWAPLPDMPALKTGHQLVGYGDSLYAVTGKAGNTTFYRFMVPQYPTTDPDDVDPPPAGWYVDEDRSAGLISWSITYGRQDYTARVAPLTATVGLAGFYAAPCPASGARFRLALSETLAAELGLTDAERVRYTGEVTDPVIDPRNPTSDVYTITGAGRLGRYRRRTVDGHTWPQEKDGARVARVLEAAGADDEAAGTIDVGVRPLIPPVRKVTAGQLLDQTSDSTGGQLVEQRTGALDWHSAEHRRGVPATVTLDAGEILNDLTFEQHVGDLVNRLELSYGRDDATVVVRDPASIDERDVYESSLSTALANAIDAHDLGLEIVGRRSEPVWQLPNLVVDLRRAITSPAKRAQLLALRFGDRITVTGMPAGAPYAGAVELYVEGITETATPRAWRLSIAVSDPLLSGVGVRWLDVDPALTWDGAAPALTWLDLARIEDPTELEA